MISHAELNGLIEAARAKGAVVEVEFDLVAEAFEGRQCIERVRVQAKGIGPNWMSAIGAGERLREFLAA